MLRSQKKVARKLVKESKIKLGSRTLKEYKKYFLENANEKELDGYYNSTRKEQQLWAKNFYEQEHSYEK